MLKYIKKIQHTDLVRHSRKLKKIIRAVKKDKKLEKEEKKIILKIAKQKLKKDQKKYIKNC